MTKIITSENRIIFDGHARTKEECETISLACEELAKSDKFRTVKYGSGYAEFEKVGKTSELKFAPGGSKGLTINFDDGIESVTYVFCNSSLANGTTISTESSNSLAVVAFTATGQTETVATKDSYNEYAHCGVVIAFKSGYEFSQMSASYIGPYTGVKYSDGVDVGTIYGFTDEVNDSFTTLTITSKAATPTISFKHRFKNDTLIGTGTYKFRRYSVEEPTPTPSGETWVLNYSVTPFTTNEGYDISFSCSGVTYSWFGGYRTSGFAPDMVCYDDVMAFKGSSWADEKYRTVTFNESPTQFLAMWLQENGTKQ